jgi:hypothetical protein
VPGVKSIPLYLTRFTALLMSVNRTNLVLNFSDKMDVPCVSSYPKMDGSLHWNDKAIVFNNKPVRSKASGDCKPECLGSVIHIHK